MNSYNSIPNKLKTVAFVISHKENEKRRALLPIDAKQLPLEIRRNICIEKDYGEVLGIRDSEYAALGINVVSTDEAMTKDILVDPKIGDALYLDRLNPGQIIYGWIHAVQGREITDAILKSRASAIAWEDMFVDGRHTFWRNNEIAGEAAIMHAYSIYGTFPYETKVALLGNGNVARGAYRILISLGADVTQYNRRCEQLFKKEMGQFDVIVNAILWDTNRGDHIINASDLRRLKSGAMIIDISCDRAGGIETSVPTTLESPIYVVDGIHHYVVDHTPSIFFRTISRDLSKIVCRTLPRIMKGELNNELRNAFIIKDGVILDQRIKEFQKR